MTRRYFTNTTIMEKEIKPRPTVLTAPHGEQISYDLRNMFGIIFMTMQTNFDPLEHINFAKFYIASIEGIRGINSVSINLDGHSGTWYFGLNKNHNPENIHRQIEIEFMNYFKNLGI